MADVTSANVVGYYGSDLTQGEGKLSMIGISMADVTKDSFQLNGDLVVDGVKGGDVSGKADHILLWDPTAASGAGGYRTFYYYDDGDEAGWTAPDGEYVEDSPKYKDAFKPGVAAWYEAKDGVEKKATFAGAVEGAAYVEPPLSEGKQLSMIVNPYPTTLQLNDKNAVVTTVTGGMTSGKSDHILLWDPTAASGAGGYRTFYYYDDGEEAGWTAPDGEYVEDSPKYKDAFVPGKGFWFEPYDAKEKCFRFLNPLKK